MNPKEAKKILPKAEYEAFESILMNQISRTPSAKLKQRASMARKLRDKYRDLAHHEAAGVRRRRTNAVDTDINDRRTRLFQEIIDHLEATLDEPKRVDADNQKSKTTPKCSKADPHALLKSQRRAMSEALRRHRD